MGVSATTTSSSLLHVPSSPLTLTSHGVACLLAPACLHACVFIAPLPVLYTACDLAYQAANPAFNQGPALQSRATCSGARSTPNCSPRACLPALLATWISQLSLYVPAMKTYEPPGHLSCFLVMGAKQEKGLSITN